MTTKRSGRQSAEAAEETRQRILSEAMTLFVQKGYDQVSMREVSDKAGVSHGLLRHHFGSKQGIWQLLCDKVYDNFQILIEHIVDNLDRKLPLNERYFQLLTQLQAYLLINPCPMRLMANTFKNGGELLDYFADKSSGEDTLLLTLLEQLQAEGYLTEFHRGEMKWLQCLFANAATELSPMLASIYPEANSKEQVLLYHWQLFARLMAAQLGIANEQIPQPTHLEELVDKDICAAVNSL